MTKTTLHTYYFDVSIADGKAAWDALRAKLKTGPHCFGPVLADNYFAFRDLDGQEIELETAHLFENQWNTASGLRVFDWALTSHIAGCRVDPENSPPHIRRGHYLDQTAEMRSLRDNTSACGYCGKQEPAAKGYVFCPHCIDSEYLKEKDLYLTRMMPVSTPNRAQLSDAERAHLLPLYRDAQLHGTTARGKARIARLRADIARDYAKAIADANAERDGFTWLLDNGFGQLAANNVIFYDHTGRFGFGWRTPCDAATVSALLEKISEFPGSYDIKCADGRTLSGN
jgi:hypothetical protein